MGRSTTIAAIVVAAGTGQRAMGDVPKQYRMLAGKPVLVRAIEAMDSASIVVPVIHPDHAERYEALKLPHEPVVGGGRRQDSVLAGLQALAPHKPDIVLIQDAARPLTPAAVVDGVIAALAEADGALPAVPVTDTIKRSADGRTIAATEDRRSLFAAQTPQGFRFPQILSAHMRASTLPREFTDDAAVAEWAGLNVVLTSGDVRNIKLTLPEDFDRAERLLGGGVRMETRIGQGFDVHPFGPGDGVTLCGVRIPHTNGLVGHSDADAGLHALCDAIYGALGEGDIGTHFPPGGMQWRGVASTIFLAHAAGLVAARGGSIVNLDLTLVCEAPKVAPHAAAMKQAIADACRIDTSRIAIKATTSEGLGFTGRGEGIVALASASIALPAQ
jgi:2-C-methyl-D-erythritol 4-phosphate cytidylyltransferase/2-C-methyl-D-erythritol 2,4-cyclodiphosphate synthase